ncbi:MAG: hypothetical protein CVU34_17545 [Betaproteobacteria bacterium HGW-Betaproteobacteria-7]|nr:MAG: hypothetical protein CVU34_17545 [Betaproteobacteria bacterium HGW-Betaproteobacteria-7]
MPARTSSADARHRSDWIELNEAIAAQTLAVMRHLEINPAKVNPLGGAITLGHQLGAAGVFERA